MATAQENFPVCPICTESFTKPKVLSCGHSFCLACLKRHVDTGEDDAEFCLCAVCRQQIKIPVDGIETFLTNYCLEKPAQVVTIATKCQNHAEKDAECYCRKCESIICYRCLYLYHKDHDNFDLESEAARVSVNEEFSKSENNIREFIDKLKTVSKTLSSTLTTFSHDECKKLDDFKKQLFADIEEKAERAKTLIRHKCGEKLSEVEKKEEEISEIAEKAEVELVSVLFSKSNESILSRVQSLPKLKQLDSKLKEEEIRLPKVNVLEWRPGNIEVPGNLGTVQIKHLLFLNPFDSPFVKTEEGDDLKVERSSTKEPDVQFSFVFNIDLKAMGNKKVYFSEDKFCVTSLRKLVWRCYLKDFQNGTIGLYVVLLEDENENIDHCVIDFRLSLPHPHSEEPVVLKQERNTRFDTNVSKGYCDNVLLYSLSLKDSIQITFDVTKVTKIVNKV